MRKDHICIVAGMPRAATTFLYYIFSKHPQVFVPSRKETEFFGINFDRGEDWYLDFFSGMSLNQIGLDISPMYFFHKEAPGRILDFNPNIRVILMVRSPVDFIISFYQNRQAATYKRIGLDSFVKGTVYRKDGKQLVIDFQNDCFKKSIERFSSTFGENLLLCDYRRFVQKPLYVLNAIEKFITVQNFLTEDNFENVRINAANPNGIKIVNKLMHSKLFADAVTLLFPRKLIMDVRYRFQSSGAQNKKTDPYISEYRKVAEEIYKLDIAFINSLFEETSLILGDGSPFEFKEKHH